MPKPVWNQFQTGFQTLETSEIVSNRTSDTKPVWNWFQRLKNGHNVRLTTMRPVIGQTDSYKRLKTEPIVFNRKIQNRDIFSSGLPNQMSGFRRVTVQTRQHTNRAYRGANLYKNKTAHNCVIILGFGSKRLLYQYIVIKQRSQFDACAEKMLVMVVNNFL